MDFKGSSLNDYSSQIESYFCLIHLVQQKKYNSYFVCTQYINYQLAHIRIHYNFHNCMHRSVHWLSMQMQAYFTVTDYWLMYVGFKRIYIIQTFSIIILGSYSMSKMAEHYQCMICLDTVKSPFECQQCHKMLCKAHLCRIGDRCPNCRLQPMKFIYSKQVDKQIRSKISEIREQQKATETFVCLVDGCEFKGKIMEMQRHRKQQHPEDSIDEIIFADVRQARKGHQIFIQDMMAKMCLIKPMNFQKAFFLYVQVQGKCELFHLVNMSIHTNRCRNEKCKKVHVISETAFIGDELGNRSSCPQAESMKAQF